MLRAIYRGFWLTVGKLLSEFAMLAALLSLAEVGRPVERILGATMLILETLAGFGIAVYRNEAFVTVMGKLQAGIDQALQDMTQNIQQDPQPTLVALVLTYAVYKIAAFFCRLTAAIAHKRAKASGTTAPPPPAEEKRPSVTSQLYRGNAS
jgi:hypothetical protein